jgi:hypothetical protein
MIGRLQYILSCGHPLNSVIIFVFVQPSRCALVGYYVIPKYVWDISNPPLTFDMTEQFLKTDWFAESLLNGCFSSALSTNINNILFPLDELAVNNFQNIFSTLIYETIILNIILLHKEIYNY